MRAPIPARALVPERVDNGLTLLDSEPDPDLDFDLDIDDSASVSSDDYSYEHTGIRLAGDDQPYTYTHTQTQTTGTGVDFWDSFIPSNPNPDITIPHTPFYYGHDNDTTAELGLGLGIGVTEEAILYTPEGGYEHLFELDLERYSFPSRQLRVARHVYNKDGLEAGAEDSTDPEIGGTAGGFLDDNTRDEIERFKREIQSQIPSEIRSRIPVEAPSTAPIPAKPKRKKQSQPIHLDTFDDRVDGTDILEDLLWEEPNEPSTCLLDLDLDLDDMEPGSGPGYRWKGPIRDIETGRPITPYRDDDGPSGVPSNGAGGGGGSASGSQASRPKQTARRGRPFPPQTGSRPGNEGRVTPDRDTSTSTGIHRLGGMTVQHKSSTRSLPSKERSNTNARLSNPSEKADGSHHRVSTSSVPSRSTHKPPTKARRENHDQSQESISPYALLLSKPQARRTIPVHLLKSASPLQKSMLTSWNSTCAESSYQEGILDLLEWLTKSINLRLSRGGAGSRDDGGRFKVDVFGSVSWGGETGTSGDLDLVVIDQNQMQGYTPDLWRVPPGEKPPPKGKSAAYRPPSSLPPVYDLYKVTQMLKYMGMRDVMPIRGANTPIVKFTVGDSGNTTKRLECDININDLGGWYNSSLILAYCEISPYVLRPMIHALKLWASSQDLNDPSGAKGPATMSSYCLTLLAIAYLQIRDHLPNLQSGINVPCPSYSTDREDPDLVWVGWGKPQGTHAHIAFSRTPPKGWEPRDPDLTAEEALRGFFAYFGSRSPGPADKALGLEDGQERFDRENMIISILNGGTLHRAERLDAPNSLSKEEKMRKESFMGKGDRGIQPGQWKERLLVVQDPFIWQKSCTNAMHVRGLEKWFDAVNRADALFTTKGNRATLSDLTAPPPASSVLPSKNSRKKRTASGPSESTANSTGGAPGQGNGLGPGQNRVDRYVERMFGNGPTRGQGQGPLRGGNRGRGSVALSRSSASNRGGGGGVVRLGGTSIGDLVDV